MLLDDVLARYVTQLQADGRSPHTVGQYCRHLRRFGQWLGLREGACDVEAIDHETIAGFLSSPAARDRSDGRSKSATSANAMRTSLRTFFRYAHEAGYIPLNPARLLRRAVCSPLPPRGLSDHEAGRLLERLAAGRGREARRDHALFALMLGTGIRLGSAIGLELRDMDFERGDLAVRRMKRDSPMFVPVPRALQAHLREYVAARRDGPLFPGRNERPMSARHVQRRLGLWCMRAGIERHVRPHDLRHTFAIRLYRKTRDLLLVQQALRHRSITSTSVYAQCDDTRLREAIAP